MWLAILGPLLVHDGEAQVDVPQGRLRVLLAALLLHAGNPVAADALAEMVWDGSPPSGAAVTLRSHVVRLRRVLGPRAETRLVTRYPGYLLQVTEEEVDALRFRGLCRDGGAALREGAWARADALLGEALGLWRGAPLADVASESLRRDEGQDLEELRLQAEEWRTGAALHLGRHDELVPRLQSLAARHPLREGFHGQLMLTLYRCGRQAEALAAYRRAREVLVTELGAEPGPGLQDLHQRILSADPALAVTEQTRPAEAESQQAVPRELPPTVPGFTGRSVELQALTGLLDRPGSPAPGAVVISAIGGTAGVGKTALAVHWAHQVAGRFPDGQLYVNLRGYDPDQPVSAADALAGFLRSLGVLGQDIPPEPEQRAARYRSLLAGKRMLVVLDNASSAGQVRPLLPGTPACAVLVTSRDALAGLVARDGAARLNLDVLPPGETVALLRTLIGLRVDTEPAAAAELAAQCCRLPLALRVAAELAAARPTVPLAALTGELADLRTRLDLLDAGGDPGTEVRAVFSWSCRHLPADAARAFRLLGMHPGPGFEPYATAALTDITVQQARRALDVLARAHLIQPAAPGRYGMHDLLRGYARELAATVDGGEEQYAALTRLFDHYLHTAAAAMDTLYPAERHRRPRIPRPATPVPPLPGPAAAREWLDAERAALVTAATHTAHDWPGHTTRLAATRANPATAAQAAGHGWPAHAIRLAAILFRYLESAGHYAEIVSVNTRARRAARDIGDRTAEAEALNNMTIVDLQQGRYEQAGDQLEQALALYQETGDRNGEARALGNLGILRYQQGRYQQAIGYQQRSLKLRRDAHDQAGEANTLNNLGLTGTRQGHYAKAADHLEQALALYQETGDRNGEAYALSNLGHVNALQASYQQAAARLDQALALFRETGDPVGEAAVLTHLGELSLLLGRHPQAGDYHRQAVALSRKMGDQSSEAEALNGLGEALLATGQPGDARTHHDTALEMTGRIGDKYQQARAHRGLARAHHAVGQPGRARSHLEQALALYTGLGTPEAEDVRAQLTATDNDSRRKREASQ
jgi:DNA-binding SARP family transcriptional activator/tetratricopeptide (TPR) repeat protein